MIDINTRVDKFRDGLVAAADQLSDAEATIIEDLEERGLDLPQLKEVLWGGHVLVDDPELYEKWKFPNSRARLSSHHKNIDKKEFPDYGLKGPVVREKLHGRTKTGTWVQLEKTPATMGNGFRLPSYHDVLHLYDFVVYRITKSNVGPWGLSKQTERHPMYLAPALTSSVPVPLMAREELLAALTQIEEGDDTSSVSPDLARRFPPPERTDTLRELVYRPGSRNGRGLFGASEVHIKVVPRGEVHEQVGHAEATAPAWSLPDPTHAEPVTVQAGDRQIRTAVRRVPAAEQEEDT